MRVYKTNIHQRPAEGRGDNCMVSLAPIRPSWVRSDQLTAARAKEGGSVRPDELKDVAGLRRAGQLQAELVNDRTYRLHPPVHLGLGIPQVKDMKNVPHHPRNMALPSRRMAKILLVQPAPGGIVCLTSVVLRCVHDVHCDRYGSSHG